MRYRKISALLLLLLFNLCTANGQVLDSAYKRLDIKIKLFPLSHYINRMNMSFNMPIDFHEVSASKELDSLLNYSCLDGQIPVPSNYLIANKDSTVLIKYSFMMFHTMPTVSCQADFMNSVKHRADTNNCQIEYLDSVVLKSVGADYGAKYNRKCGVIFSNSLLRNSSVILYSKNEEKLNAWKKVYVDYYYTDEYLKKISKTIASTYTQLKFK